MAKNKLAAWFAALAMILTGALMVLNNFGIVALYRNLWVPIVLLIVGILQVTDKRTWARLCGICALILGLAFLLSTFGKLHWDPLLKLWPSLYISLGLALL